MLIISLITALWLIKKIFSIFPMSSVVKIRSFFDTELLAYKILVLWKIADRIFSITHTKFIILGKRYG
ncbi:MAG: hypothetical protein ACTTNM_03440 [Arsenophonus sp.]